MMRTFSSLKENMQALKENFKEDFASRLQRAMIYRGLKAADVAKSAGISPGQISEALKGKKPLGVTSAGKVAALLGLPLSWLHLGEGPDPLISPNEFSNGEPARAALSIISSTQPDWVTGYLLGLLQNPTPENIEQCKTILKSQLPESHEHLLAK